MMINIECPKCGTTGSQSLIEPDYEAPTAAGNAGSFSSSP